MTSEVETQESVQASQLNSAEDLSGDDKKHIRDVRETDDSYIIEFGKSDPEEMPEENQDKQDS